MEFQNFHGRVLVLFHYLLHSPNCSVPTVDLHKSTDDGLTATPSSRTSHIAERRVRFGFNHGDTTSAGEENRILSLHKCV